ncbi:MAG: RNA-binding transcriptional accessory protein [Chloroflexi bacterium]|nr:RNA-binding transcriptional accessory protein [Chloroflexota bacterium]
MSETERHLAAVARELNVSVVQVRATAELLDEGATVPFIARYRKEATGSLDEVAITSVRDRLAQLAAVDDRRAAIVASLEERQLLTEDLHHKLNAAETLATLEDVYQPFRPKRRTRASVARERGLEPLAEVLLRQDPRIDPIVEGARFLGPEVPDAEAALQGARDIIAERASDDADMRSRMRRLFWQRGMLRSSVRSGRETTGARFRDYFDWSEPISSAPSHRVLAVFRGESEEALSVSIQPPEGDALAIVERAYVRGTSRSSEQVRLAVRDGYKRLLSRAMETETHAEAKRRADAAAIGVFAQNLRQLLLAPPLGQKRVLAIDPGVRTGCKTVVLDAQGQLLFDTVIYPDQRRRDATDIVLDLIRRYEPEAIAVGNGTGGRETEAFIRSLQVDIPVISVNESGASVYSASEVARAEFPDRDITVRGAVSIGRRLMDPLAELVKIDPKSIGVGQHQHDVDQDDLRKSLDDVVTSCVNAVGVEVNTASKQLLAYVSGLSSSVADNIVRYRSEHGPFRNRQDLIRVPRLGAKAFEQSAGFLRIHGAANPLDASAVHPESYSIVDRMAADLSLSVRDLVQNASLQARINPERYVTSTIGLPTLNDILAELARPGRDPRASIEVIQFREGIHKLEDLEPGMLLPGVVTNVTAFGAFVDVGVHQDGLVHISQLADRFVRDPNEVVRVQQPVQVRVLEVDLNRRRIALSMRRNVGAGAPQ